MRALRKDELRWVSGGGGYYDSTGTWVEEIIVTGDRPDDTPDYTWEDFLRDNPDWTDNNNPGGSDWPEDDGNSGGDTSQSSTPEQKAAENGIAVKNDRVNISNLSEKMTDTFDNIAQAWRDHAGGKTPTITSGNDSTHGTNSLHYADNAIDLRTTADNLTSEQIQNIANSLRASLGDDYDVVVEGDHIHLEYDPD